MNSFGCFNFELHDKKILLHHGSKGGILGEIVPRSHIRSDMGNGFYLSNDREQAIERVANELSPLYYLFSFDIGAIPEENVLCVEGMEWVHFVLYNRGILDKNEFPDLFDLFKSYEDKKEIVVGPIADEVSNELILMYAAGKISGNTLKNCLKELKYDLQFVLKTKNVCSLLETVKIEKISVKEAAAGLRDLALKKENSAGVIDGLLKKYAVT